MNMDYTTSSSTTRMHNHAPAQQTTDEQNLFQPTAPVDGTSTRHSNSIYPVIQQQANLSQVVDTSQQATTHVELSISCRNLPNTDIVGKSDAQVIVYSMDVSGKQKSFELGRTEVIPNNLNPHFVKKIVLKYHFEQMQRLRFEVFDIDPLSNDYLGHVETTLADIIVMRGQDFKRALVGGPRGKPGLLVLTVEELISCKQVVRFRLAATNLPTICCGMFYPSASVHIYKTSESSQLTIVHRSKAVARTSNPVFDKFELKLLSLCNGDTNRVLRFELFDTRFNLNYPIGHFESTIRGLSDACKHQSKSATFEMSSSAKVTIDDFCILNQASFLDYIKAGTQIHFVIAVDFTASNGDPSLPDSLHYIGASSSPLRRLNPYESALTAIGNILKPYDSMGMFAGFGFGAKLLGPNKPPSHLFPLNGNEQHPYVKSIEELVQVYRQKLCSVILSGPTNFSPCIDHCEQIARQFDDGSHYFVLLILTDGIISDMQQTKRAIIRASSLPLSIIICGVGDADFTAMNELDSDDVVMRVDGKAAERDIVQFVPMNQFESKGGGGGNSAYAQHESQSLLAEEVLREIPDQLTGYMVSRGFHTELTEIRHL